MSLRDLVESDCGGSNSLVKLSTHFVQDHALKDQDLKHPVSDEKEDQQFLEASTRELAEQYFSSTETDTFKMDALLDEMRKAEVNSQENAWPTQFTENIAKQDKLFDLNIWSSSENKMMVKEEIYDFGYNPECVKEIEQSYQSQENNITKSRFDFNRSKENVMKFGDINDGSVMRDELVELYQNIENRISVTENNFGMRFYDNPYQFGNQGFQHDLLRRFSQEWDVDNVVNMSSTMPPSTSRVREPISVIGQPTLSAEQEAQTNKIENNTEIGNEQFNFKTEFEEMENIEKSRTYVFTPENEMDSVENPLAEGKRRLENGELPLAVLCFEAAVKQENTNAEAWQLLGTTQAENEQDQQAITSLNKCLELQPDNLTAVLCLAACYTNESLNVQACRMLRKWLNLNPKYTDIVNSKQEPDELDIMKFMFSTKLYETIKDMYIEAAQRSLETGGIDAEVQNGLGVLLNLNNENDKAVDCFKAALQIRPQDARLWNRLGATLANGGRCEEAIEAYHNALQLCPGFVRARYNLGITCIHLETYREAVEHLLEALNQQASVVKTNVQSPAFSDTIWSTLRLAISMAERPELLKAVNNRNLDLLNEEFSYNSNVLNDN